jgi:uncharacterized metal-binding protein YceD (DUF177 family)
VESAVRVPVVSIEGEQVVRITGDEDWLAAIYADFPAPEDAAPSRLTGRLTLVRSALDVVDVTGELRFAPMVDCSRCSRSIPWSLDVPVQARFTPPPSDTPARDLRLSAADLDAYYFDEGAVDVAGLVNDAVQTSLPLRFVATTPDGKSCRICGVDVSSERVFGQGEETDEKHPFAVLKGLKLPN